MNIEDWVNGIAGIAALVNSLLLWPTIKSLKALAEDHGQKINNQGERINKLERKKPRRRTL